LKFGTVHLPSRESIGNLPGVQNEKFLPNSSANNTGQNMTKPYTQPVVDGQNSSGMELYILVVFVCFNQSETYS